MKFRLIKVLFALLFICCLPSQSFAQVGKTPSTVEEAEALLAKKEKEKQKAAKKARKEAEKRFWSMQTKDRRKSVKKNYKRQKNRHKSLL
jgi:hypothetical protein